MLNSFKFQKSLNELKISKSYVRLILYICRKKLFRPVYLEHFLGEILAKV